MEKILNGMSKWKLDRILLLVKKILGLQLIDRLFKLMI